MTLATTTDVEACAPSISSVFLTLFRLRRFEAPVYCLTPFAFNGSANPDTSRHQHSPERRDNGRAGCCQGATSNSACPQQPSHEGRRLRLTGPSTRTQFFFPVPYPFVPGGSKGLPRGTWPLPTHWKSRDISNPRHRSKVDRQRTPGRSRPRLHFLAVRLGSVEHGTVLLCVLSLS